MAAKDSPNIARSAGLTLEQLHSRAGSRVATLREDPESPAAPAEDEFSRAIQDAQRVDALAIRRSARQRMVLEGQVEEEELQSRIKETQARRVLAEAEVEKTKLELRRMQQEHEGGQGEFMLNYVSKLEEQIAATRAEISDLREAGRQAEVGALQQSLASLQEEIASMRTRSLQAPKPVSLAERIKELRELRQEWQALEEDFGGLRGPVPEVAGDGSDVGGQIMLYRVKREMDIRQRVEDEKLRVEEDDLKDRRSIERLQTDLTAQRNQIIQQNLPTIFQALETILRGFLSQQGRLPADMAPQQQEVQALFQKLGATPGEGVPPQLINCACGAQLGVAPGQNRVMCVHCGAIYEPREGPTGGNHHLSGEGIPASEAQEEEVT